MTKYILKESELESMIAKIIMEEASRVDEGRGFFRSLGKLAFDTGRLFLNPYAAAGRGLEKLAGGEPVKSLAGIGAGAAVAGAASSRKLKGKRDRKKLGDNSKIDECKKFIHEVNAEFGEPEMSGALSNKLASKQIMNIPNFLGTGSAVSFGGRYLEKSQFSPSSHWSKKYAKAEKIVAKEKDSTRAIELAKEFQKEFAEWLEERDEAYVDYEKALKKIEKEKGRK